MNVLKAAYEETQRVQQAEFEGRADVKDRKKSCLEFSELSVKAGYGTFTYTNDVLTALQLMSSMVSTLEFADQDHTYGDLEVYEIPHATLGRMAKMIRSIAVGFNADTSKLDKALSLHGVNNPD